ncbi:MAG: Tad domain-containing protein [Candidatus Obscuribacterales bacterium]
MRNQRPTYRKQDLRRKTGQLSILVLVFLVASLIAMGALGVDIAHIVCTTEELQRAVDAGALAGGPHLSELDKTQAVAEALSITADNKADGSRVSNEVPGTIVTVVTTNATTNSGGTVTVSAQKRITHLFAHLFGRHTDIVYASATAGGIGEVTQIPSGSAFPIAISIDAATQVGGAQAPLMACQPGQAFTLYFDNKEDKNAAFTSFNTGSADVQYFNEAMSEALGLTHSDPAVIPSVSVGSVINLNNGEGGYQAMSHEFYSKIMAKPYILLPLIENPPPLNQSGVVIGFVALKVTEISKRNGVASMSGIIVKPAVLGRSGDTPINIYSQALKNLSPSTVRLIP